MIQFTPMNIKIELSSADFVFAGWGRVLVGIWRGRTTANAIRSATQLVGRYARESEGALSLMTVVEKNAPAPPSDARVELANFLRGGNGQVQRHGLVFEGEGIRAASIRAVVAGVAFFSRPEYPYRVFDSAGSAARFLAGGGPATGTIHQIVRVVNEARRQLAPRTIMPWPDSPSPVESLRPR
ncbi:MAG TPA: hypothetical protein VG963_05725 [Polyangiaceae bacterium]|nr:hypothetical protein [Polyangiaceae bacterium]